MAFSSGSLFQPTQSTTSNTGNTHNLLSTPALLLVALSHAIYLNDNYLFEIILPSLLNMLQPIAFSFVVCCNAFDSFSLL